MPGTEISQDMGHSVLKSEQSQTHQFAFLRFGMKGKPPTRTGAYVEEDSLQGMGQKLHYQSQNSRSEWD